MGFDIKDPLSVLEELIVEPSINPPGKEKPVMEKIAMFFQSIGVPAELQEVLPGRPNVIATLRFSEHGRTLILNTHLDVNPIDEHEWATPPFEPVIKGGRVYGRGSADAKGSAAGMIAAMARVVSKPGSLHGRVVFTGVMGEEAGGIGSHYLVDEGIEGDAVVVGEPTEGLVATAHKGTYRPKFRLLGKAFHSSRPDCGTNAISHAATLISQIDLLHRRLQKNKHSLVGSPSICTTMIQGGLKINTIPPSCEIVLDRRLIPGETREMADEQIRQCVEQTRTLVGRNFQIELIDILTNSIPCETPTDSEIVQVGLTAANAESPTGFGAGCDLKFFVEGAGIPGIILGPGSIAQAHGADEFVPIDQLYAVSNIYEKIIRQFLSPDRSGRCS